MKTKVKFNPSESLLNGVRIMADAVTTTLGPRGRNVAIAYSDQRGNIFQRKVLHDGVTVAKSIDLADEFENMGAQLLKEAAQKQVDAVGDGTTVSILLARSLIEEINALTVAGINPMEIRKELEKSVDLLVKEIESIAIDVTTFEQKKHIATVSAEDEELGQMVAQVIEDMGADGLVAVEESKNSETTVEKQEGMQLEKGFMHQLFTTNPDRAESVLDDTLVLVTDSEINSLLPMKDLIERLAREGEKLTIVCPFMGPDAMGALLQNKMQGVLLSTVIFAPSFGSNQESVLQDIAIYTGGTFVTKDTGTKLEQVKKEDLGRARKVVSNKDYAVIIGGHGDKKQIEERIELIKANLANEDGDFDKEKLKERLAKLTSGVSVIRVGGATEVEMHERLERVKDAVAATKAAVTTGIVPGGEVVYLEARKKLDTNNIIQNMVFKALYEPFKKLLNNAGLDDGQMYDRLTKPKWVFSKQSGLSPKEIEMIDFDDPGQKIIVQGTIDEAVKNIGGVNNAGVNVITGQVVDMVKEGLVDPAAVPIQALINAASVAVQISTTGAIVVPDKDELPKLSQ